MPVKARSKRATVDSVEACAGAAAWTGAGTVAGRVTEPAGAIGAGLAAAAAADAGRAAAGAGSSESARRKASRTGATGAIGAVETAGAVTRGGTAPTVAGAVCRATAVAALATAGTAT